MKKIVFCAVLCAMMMTMACNNTRNEQQEQGPQTTSEGYVDRGDSTLYGLACDGCTDTVLVFLPHSGGDPVTFHILEAMKAHRVFGHPEIGDWVGVVLSKENPRVADVVIDLDQLKGTWTYDVLPTLKRRAGMGEEDNRQAMEPEKNDSMLKKWMVPQEYGFVLKRHFTASAAGGYQRHTSLDEDIPVEYPPRKRYTEWHIHNGRLVLTQGVIKVEGQKAMGNDRVVNDTADFVLMMGDTLVLRFNDHVQGYHRKNDSTSVAKN